VTALPAQAYIGIGSNLDDPAAQVGRACEALAGLPRTDLVACSALYRSAPMGPPDQPDYVNAVAALATGLEPLSLLDALQAVENRHGRVRGRRWGERVIDLDLLVYGDARIDAPRLRVPHPGLAQRAFVLVPLAEIAPDLVVPGVGRVRDLVSPQVRARVRPLDDPRAPV
jgi:2-amino-4-hydroxy-6-hydroxymethyldihydropteridine diphosphokinase